MGKKALYMEEQGGPPTSKITVYHYKYSYNIYKVSVK